MHLLLEKGHPPADSVHAPVIPQYTPPAGPSRDQARESLQQVKDKPELYNFVTKGEWMKHQLVFVVLFCVDLTSMFVVTENVFDVCLLKNTSGLGFSFSREEHIPGELPGSSMVRVKKLFPGQPAAESGRIRVGDVILRVNQTPLKGLSQHVW